ncbi:MAG: magnesium and cobalt transport protein CorA [Chlamydiae bacterium]|nr:magnesium and cobalt transport protein CorA [Chlamydiota bacterium]
MVFRNKKHLYILVNFYLKGEINEVTFCDEFYKAYNLGEVEERLEETEDSIFNPLSEVAGRFSEFESDHQKYPGVYYTKAELAEKILETKIALMKIHPEYFP